jgi:hypothetical protein
MELLSCHPSSIIDSQLHSGPNDETEKEKVILIGCCGKKVKDRMMLMD